MLPRWPSVVLHVWVDSPSFTKTSTYIQLPGCSLWFGSVISTFTCLNKTLWILVLVPKAKHLIKFSSCLLSTIILNSLDFTIDWTDGVWHTKPRNHFCTPELGYWLTVWPGAFVDTASTHLQKLHFNHVNKIYHKMMKWTITWWYLCIGAEKAFRVLYLVQTSTFL